MLKIWGRNTSINVQKVIWALGEIELAHERIDVGGAFGKNNEPALSGDESELAGADARGGGRLHPVGIELDRALSRRQAWRRHARAGRPAGARQRQTWMDWQLSVMRAGDPAGVLGPDPHAAGEARSRRRSTTRKEKTTATMRILDAQLGKTAFWPAMNSPSATSRSALIDLSLPPAGAGAQRPRQSRSLVRRDRAAAGVQGARARDSVCVSRRRYFRCRLREGGARQRASPTASRP